MPRIGELLLEHGWVDQANLRRALSEQALAGGKRLCSLLIARGLLDPDHAARALGEQHEVPAVLQRHLEHRDRALAELIPAAIARSLTALPIGTTRTGELIVCVRDPSPEVDAAIRRALDRPLVIAVAPASQLEQLIDEAYGTSEGENEFDVDLSTGTQIEPPLPRLDDETSMPEFGTFTLVGLDDAGVTKNHNQTFTNQRDTPPPFASVTPPFANPLDPPTSPPRPSPFANPLDPPTSPPRPSPFDPPTSPPRPLANPLDPPTSPPRSSPFSSLTPPFATATPPNPTPIPALDLDPEEDAIEDFPPPPPPPRPPTTPPPPTPALGTQPPRSSSPSSPPRVMIPKLGEPLPRGPIRTPTAGVPILRLSIQEAVAAIADAISRDTATELAMRYAAGRWASSLLLAVKEGAALGHRGHGKHLPPDAVRAVAIPLSSPSILKSAHDNRALATEPPPGVGAIHERLVRLLGSPRAPVAAPIVVAGRIACLIVVGDSTGSGDSAGDLDRLAAALGEAYTRILRDMK